MKEEEYYLALWDRDGSEVRLRLRVSVLDESLYRAVAGLSHIRL